MSGQGVEHWTQDQKDPGFNTCGASNMLCDIFVNVYHLRVVSYVSVCDNCYFMASSKPSAAIWQCAYYHAKPLQCVTFM